MCGFSLNILDEFAESLSGRWLTFSTLTFGCPRLLHFVHCFLFFFSGLFLSSSSVFTFTQFLAIPFYHAYSDYISMNNDTGIVLLNLNLQFCGI